MLAMSLYTCKLERAMLSIELMPSSFQPCPNQCVLDPIRHRSHRLHCRLIVVPISKI